MKTAWLLVLVMSVATAYLFDVAGARRPLEQAYGFVGQQLGRAVDGVADRLPEPPRP